MPSRPTSGQWVRVELYVNGYDKLFSNVFWYLADGISFDPTFDFKGDADALIAHLANGLKPLLHTTMTILGGDVIFNDGTGSYGVEVYNQTAGSAPTGAAMPEDLALIVQKHTGFLGATHRGRWYISGVCNVFTVGNYINSGGHAAMIAAGVVFAAGVSSGGGGDYSPAHFSPKLGELFAISTCSPVDLVGTSRRRRPRF